MEILIIYIIMLIIPLLSTIVINFGLNKYKKQKNKDVVVRPASNFRLTYNAQADGYSMKKYTTDPEENERTYPIQIPWGTGLFNE